MDNCFMAHSSHFYLGAKGEGQFGRTGSWQNGDLSHGQGTLTEGKGSVRLTSSLG
jgi:hypothetical protein